MSTRNTPMTEEETKALRILALETQLENSVTYAEQLTAKYLEASGKLQSDIHDLKRQRDALLEMTWLDLPSEPQESIAEWRKLFEEGWERKPTARRVPAGVVLSRLFAMSENAEKAADMSNAELAEELRRKLGDITNMHELAYDLIEEAATRLAKMADGV